MKRVLTLMLLLVATPALAQFLPSSKPPPLGAGEMPPAMAAPGYRQAPPAIPAPAPADQAAQPGRCAAPLAQGCLRMQSSCQMACPGTWSTNPSAPAFTPTDRAGCMQRCFHQYLACNRQYGC